MPILKKGEIEAKATAYGTEVKSTGYVFYSYDKKASALFFQFRNQNGETTDIANAKIRLLLIKNDDEDKEFIPNQEDFEIISKPGGKAKFVLPEMLLAYQGKVTGYIYLDFEDGSQTDEGQFTFRIRRSMITHVLPAMGDKYVQDFEDIKERVEQAGDSATKDIEKAKDDAESQIGDYVGEVESAKQDISSSASDVQSKASEANEDILNLVKSTEDARDDAVKSMNELDYSNRNLLKGTSDEWEERTFSDWTSDFIILHLKDVGLQPGDIFTYAVDIDNTIDKVNTDEVRSSITFRDSDDNKIGAPSTKYISGGKKERAMSTAEIPEKTSVIRIAKFSKKEGKKQKTFAIRKAMLNCGTRAAPWTPAPEDIGTKSELEKIKQAIINLGGSI